MQPPFLAVKHYHRKICSKRRRGAKKGKTVGHEMDKYLAFERFGYYQNIIIYRAKSGKSCQFGTTSAEAIMFELKTYNSNVLTSTRERCKLTLDLFSFGKVVSMHLKKLAPPGRATKNPGSCHSHAMSLFRVGLANGTVRIPSTEKVQKWDASVSRKRPAAAFSERVAKRARR